MAQIYIHDLSFSYDNHFDLIFEHASFSLDTCWKLGLIGRNGKGKTTLLRILLGEYPYSGSISAPVPFDYFPYEISQENKERCASDFLSQLKANCEEWRVLCELGKLNLDAELLYRPFKTLSHGEQTKVLLAVLFSGENDFLLIDEPTNHLDQESRKTVKEYLQKKNGFILVSHDRDLLDGCVDHILVLNRKTIEVQTGNFSSWWENKKRKDRFAMAENEKHLKEIASLKRAADQSGRWAEKNENTKIGYDPVKNHDRHIGTRAYIGSKTKKMQSRVTQYKKRMERAREEKEGLLQDIETPAELKLNPLTFHKERLIACRDLSIRYGDKGKAVLDDFSFTLMQGERIFLHGMNGCGKSTLIKAIQKQSGNNPYPENMQITISGQLFVAANLIISSVSQDTRFLHGEIKKFCAQRNLNESLFFALLRQLDFERGQFVKRLEELSEGQKKKVLIAASLLTPAHIYIWDEPLNYIDVFSRIQIEELLLKYQPTMILVEHDIRFREKIATRIVEMKS